MYTYIYIYIIHLCVCVCVCKIEVVKTWLPFLGKATVSSLSLMGLLSAGIKIKMWMRNNLI